MHKNQFNRIKNENFQTTAYIVVTETLSFKLNNSRQCNPTPIHYALCICC